MSSSAYAYGVIGYKLDTRSCLYKPQIKPTKDCCSYTINNNSRNPKFCSECGTNLEQFKLNRIDEYVDESVFGLNVFDRNYHSEEMDLNIVIYDTNVSPSSPSYNDDNIQKLDISKMDESKEKIKKVLEKLKITFEEERFGVWIISYLSY
jgi:hypothetical protein